MVTLTPKTVVVFPPVMVIPKAFNKLMVGTRSPNPVVTVPPGAFNVVNEVCNDSFTPLFSAFVAKNTWNKVSLCVAALQLETKVALVVSLEPTVAIAESAQRFACV